MQKVNGLSKLCFNCFMGTEYQPIELIRTNIKIYCLGFADDMAVLTGDIHMAPKTYYTHLKINCQKNT